MKSWKSDEICLISRDQMHQRHPNFDLHWSRRKRDALSILIHPPCCLFCPTHKNKRAQRGRLNPCNLRCVCFFSMSRQISPRLRSRFRVFFLLSLTRPEQRDIKPDKKKYFIIKKTEQNFSGPFSRLFHVVLSPRLHTPRVRTDRPA